MNTHGATVNRGEIVSMYAGLNATTFLHSNFLSVPWLARGGANGNVPACDN